MRQHVSEMLGGPGTLRFFLQPIMAIALGILHGLGDARAGRPPFLMGLIRERGQRSQRLREVLWQIVIPLTIALIASVVFQSAIRSRVNVLYAMVYAFLFVAVPYFAARGVANRLARAPRRRSAP